MALVRTLALLAAFRIFATLGQNFSTELFLSSNQLFFNTSQLPLHQCCNFGALYKPGMDYCKNESFFLDVEPLSISSLYSDDKVIVSLNDDERIETQRMLKACKEGFISKTSDRFQLFEDFSMTTEEGESYSATEYCIYPQTSKSDRRAPFQYAVRYCVHADCDAVPCIRKCCPLGMAVNLNRKECELNDDPFNETVHQMLNIKSEMKIVGGFGFGMHCYDESTMEMELNEFRILPSSGEMYAPEYPYSERTTFQYCVDNFVYIENAQNQNQKIEMKGLRCFPEYGDLKVNQLSNSIYPHLLLVSSLFLFFTFLVYAFLASDIANAHGLIVMCYVASMSILYVCLAIFQLQWVVPKLALDPGYTCIGLAVVTHFFFLATFSWLHVMCYDIWRTFRKSTPNPFHGRVGKTFLSYSFVGWGFPFLIVLTGQVFDRIAVESRGSIISPLFGEGQSCWFNEWKSLLIYLYGPMLVMVFANVFFFVMTAAQLCRTRKDSALALRNQQSQNHITRQRIRVIFSLFVLMGVSWSMEVISVAVGGSYAVWYIFDMLNIFTGVFVFIIFVCKKKVWQMLKKKFRAIFSCCNKQNAALRASRTSRQSFCRHQSRSSVSTASQLYYLRTNDLMAKLSQKSVDEEDTCI